MVHSGHGRGVAGGTAGGRRQRESGCGTCRCEAPAARGETGRGDHRSGVFPGGRTTPVMRGNEQDTVPVPACGRDPARTCHVRAVHTFSRRSRPPSGGPRRPVPPNAAPSRSRLHGASTAVPATPSMPGAGRGIRSWAGVETHSAPGIPDASAARTAGPGPCEAGAWTVVIMVAWWPPVIGEAALAVMVPWHPSAAMAGAPCMKNRPSSTAHTASSRAKPGLPACVLSTAMLSLPSRSARVTDHTRGGYDLSRSDSGDPGNDKPVRRSDLTWCRREMARLPRLSSAAMHMTAEQCQRRDLHDDDSENGTDSPEAASENWPRARMQPGRRPVPRSHADTPPRLPGPHQVRGCRPASPRTAGQQPGAGTRHARRAREHRSRYSVPHPRAGHPLPIR